MQAIPLLVSSFDDFHAVLREEMSTVEPEALRWRAGPGVNTIAFLFWHIVRDEDVVISEVCRLPQVWTEDDFATRLGLPEQEQGTAMDPADAGHIDYDMAAFMGYAESVWQRTSTALPRLPEAALDQTAWPGSNWNNAQLLVEGCLGHSWLHLGEIRFCRGLLGWRGPE